MRKKFDKDLHAKHDKSAKEVAIKLLKKLGVKAVEPPRKTDVDLHVYQGEDHIYNVEVEVKNVWSGHDFPYESVQFPHRKEKYAKLDKPTIFLMFNKQLDCYLAVTGKDLLASPVAMVRNKYVKFGENFFQVPLDKVAFDDLSSAVKKLGV